MNIICISHAVMRKRSNNFFLALDFDVHLPKMFVWPCVRIHFLQLYECLLVTLTDVAVAVADVVIAVVVAVTQLSCRHNKQTSLRTKRGHEMTNTQKQRSGRRKI